MPYMLDGRKLRQGRSFTDKNGTQYPSNWLKLSSNEDKARVGITYKPDPAPFDSRYYYSAGNPRPVADGIDDDGNEYTGLKTNFAKEQKTVAGQMLSNTDWYVTRKAETGVDVPADVSTYRAAVRTVCNAREVEITSVTTTEELEALMKAPTQVYDQDTDTMVVNPKPYLTPWPELDQ
jgi:hypothetical protein